jgi:nucleotide-binding universal stress UspA family protein
VPLPVTPQRQEVRPGAVIDGWVVGERLHEGGTGYVYHVRAPAGADPGLPLVMKVPGVGRAEPTIGIVGFEIEQMILPMLTGRMVPRFVASGDLTRTPYIVMERIDGEPLTHVVARAPLAAEEVARIGAALADAVHSIHSQSVNHLDLKPENFILRSSGEAVLFDFGFARHAHYPDLLAEARHYAAGSAAYVSPEQLKNDRSDPRSDLFALGVLLFELATGDLPFGEPRTYAGMRDRLWKAPIPPRAVNGHVPAWLQEIILRCLARDAADRYQSASHIAFDLRHPEQVALSTRAHRTRGAGFMHQVWRWWRAQRGSLSAPVRHRADGTGRTPIILVAVDTEHRDDERQPALLAATRDLLQQKPDFRLMCVSVIRAAPLGEGRDLTDTASGRHLEHKTRLRWWVEPLKLEATRVSLHVIEAANAADALLELVHANHVDLVVLGAPQPDQHAFGWWRSVASSVTSNARCSVYVVRVGERREPGDSP